MSTPKRHREDLALVRRVCAGDPAAVQELETRMRIVPSILAARNARTGRLLGGDELADLGQEVKASIWRRLDSFLGQSALETWMHTFCVHELMNAQRRQHRQLHVQQGLPEAGVPDLRAHEPLHLMQFDAVYQALAQLPPLDESILRMRHFDLYKFHEMAEELGLPVNTVKTRYYRAMLRMKTLLHSHEREAGE